MKQKNVIYYKKGDVVKANKGFVTNFFNTKYLLILEDVFFSPYLDDTNGIKYTPSKGEFDICWYSVCDINNGRFFKRLHNSYIKGLITISL